MNDSYPTIRPETADCQLDRQIAVAVFGYDITEVPGAACLATIGAGATTKFVEVPPVSTDLKAAWQAATIALGEGQADGFHAGVMTKQDGPPEYTATFMRDGEDAVAPICGATADSMPRAICGALLALYGSSGGKRPNTPVSRVLQ